MHGKGDLWKYVDSFRLLNLVAYERITYVLFFQL